MVYGDSAGSAGDQLRVPQDAMQQFQTSLGQLIQDSFDSPDAPTQPQRVQLNTIVAISDFGNHADAAALGRSYAPVQDQLYQSLVLVQEQLQQMHKLFGTTITSFDQLERNITLILGELSEPGPS